MRVPLLALLLRHAAGASAGKPAAPGSSCTTVRKDTALGGHNLKDYVDKTMNVTRCCEFCDATAGCVGWTLDARNSHCYAKDRIDKPKKTGVVGSISGQRPGVKPAPPAPVPGAPKVHPVPGDKPVPAPAGAKNVLFIICVSRRPVAHCAPCSSLFSDMRFNTPVHCPAQDDMRPQVFSIEKR